MLQPYKLILSVIFATAALLAAGSEAAEWQTRAPLLEANSETAVAQMGDKIYVFGGYPRLRITVDTAIEYDAKTDSWRHIARLPVKTNHAMAAAVNGRVYVIGGQQTAGGRRVGGRFQREDPKFLNRVFAWNPSTNQWAEKAPMPSKRSGGVAVAAGGKIYVAGGRTRESGDDFAVYDPEADRWTVLPDVPTQRNHLGAAAIDGKIYVVGGRFGPGFRSPKTDALEVYDPAANTWSKRKPMLRPRGGINAVAANGCLHVFGGEGNDEVASGVYPDHDVYDPRSDSWRALDAMPVPVHGVTGMAFVNGWIHFPGGGTRIGGSSGNVIHQVVRTDITCR
ncbi:MAG: hypothetical protein CMM10_11100 [Rhodospirillaceae bacterium]|nr:hypothetical protein [Rhodospirillaceae bacterium]